MLICQTNLLVLQLKDKALLNLIQLPKLKMLRCLMRTKVQTRRLTIIKLYLLVN
jgi:hypothetical protein